MTDSASIASRKLPTWQLARYSLLCGARFDVNGYLDDLTLSVDMQEGRILVNSDNTQLESIVVNPSNPPTIQVKGNDILWEHISPYSSITLSKFRMGFMRSVDHAAFWQLLSALLRGSNRQYPVPEPFPPDIPHSHLNDHVVPSLPMDNGNFGKTRPNPELLSTSQPESSNSRSQSQETLSSASQPNTPTFVHPAVLRCINHDIMYKMARDKPKSGTTPHLPQTFPVPKARASEHDQVVPTVSDAANANNSYRTNQMAVLNNAFGGPARRLLPQNGALYGKQTSFNEFRVPEVRTCSGGAEKMNEVGYMGGTPNKMLRVDPRAKVMQRRDSVLSKPIAKKVQVETVDKGTQTEKELETSDLTKNAALLFEAVASRQGSAEVIALERKCRLIVQQLMDDGLM